MSEFQEHGGHAGQGGVDGVLEKQHTREGWGRGVRACVCVTQREPREKHGAVHRHGAGVSGRTGPQWMPQVGQRGKQPESQSNRLVRK